MDKLKVIGRPRHTAEVEFSGSNVEGARKAFFAQNRDYDITSVLLWNEEDQDWYEVTNWCEACGTVVDPDYGDSYFYDEDSGTVICRPCGKRAIAQNKENT